MAASLVRATTTDAMEGAGRRSRWSLHLNTRRWRRWLLVQLVSVRNDEREEDGTLYTPSTPQKESWGNSYNRLLDNYDMALRRTLPK